MIMKRLLWVFILIVISCSPSVEGLLDDGWRAFEAGDFETAKSCFLDAIEINNDCADAYNGLGWSCAKLDDISQATRSFQSAINKDHNLWDSYAGFAIVEMDYENAVNKASTVITNEPNYCFSHDTTVTIEDIYLCRAHGRVCLGEFEEALSDVRVIDPIFNADINTHEGREELIRRIEELLISYL